MQQYNQVSGGNCRLVLYRETSPGVVNVNDTGVVLSMMSETFSAPANKQGSAVISGKRGQGKPYAGVPEYTGGVELAPYAPLLGHILRALCGAPVSTAQTSLVLSGAVTNEGCGFVGFPCTDNPFVQDTIISVVGSTNYDGSYRLEYGTTTTKLVVKTPFTAETLSDVTAYRGRVAFLSGAVVDKSGKVGLPVTGLSCSLNAGESITISGTTNYNGSYTLLAGTTSKLLLITEEYAAETLASGAVAVPVFTKHSFALPNRQPTVCIEKYLDFDEDAEANAYTAFSSCKLNGLSFPFGGGDELKLTLDFSVGSANSKTTPVNAATPSILPAIPFQDKETALWINEERVGDIESGTLSLAFGIEAKAAVGDMGKRTRQPEGDPTCTCSLVAFLEHDEYTRLSEGAATIPFALSLSGANGEEFCVKFPEAELDTSGAQISGKAGLTQEITATAFVDQAESVVTFELINRVASYA